MDGLMESKIKPITYFGVIFPEVFGRKGQNEFKTDNGSWAVFGGVKGATDDNYILLAQITTEGKLSFELNLQVGSPTGANINFVARNPYREEIVFPSLIYKQQQFTE